MKKALCYGILGSLFFAFTFIFNRSMNLEGGYWLWSASLRYIFMLPMLWLLLARRHGTGEILQEMKEHPVPWILWSTVGFGLFYMPLTMASVYGESWFVAAAWQITIIAGILLTPFFGEPIPGKKLLFSAVILGGIFLLQLAHADSMDRSGLWTAMALILLAGISYPLGNRKMLVHCPARFNTIQRVFGMTLCSMPFWILCAGYAAVTHGMPGTGQVIQSVIVALFSGVVATILFFEATHMVQGNTRNLAVIEATQSGEVLFALLGGILFLGDNLPTAAGFAGIAVIIAGMTCASMSR